MTEAVKPVPTLDSLRAMRGDILRLMDKYGAYNVRVFGSVARGDATPESDVDFVVDLVRGKTVFDLVGLWLDLKEMLGLNVSLLTNGAIEGEFKANVERDAVPL